MRDTAQVVVIGGGAVGAAVLWHLAEAGITETLLVEKSELTAGSTWHAAGNIPTYANSWLGMRAGNYAWKLYKELALDPAAPITYRHTGAVWPAHSRERMESVPSPVRCRPGCRFRTARDRTARNRGDAPLLAVRRHGLGRHS